MKVTINKVEQAVSQKSNKTYYKLETSAGRLVYFGRQAPQAGEAEVQVEGTVAKHIEQSASAPQAAPAATEQRITEQLTTIEQTVLYFKILREQAADASVEAALDVAARIAISESINNANKNKKWSK